MGKAHSIGERARVLWPEGNDNRTAVAHATVQDAVASLAHDDAWFSYRTVRGLTTFTVSDNGPHRVINGEVRLRTLASRREHSRTGRGTR